MGAFPNVHFYPSHRGLWYQPYWILKKGKQLIDECCHDVVTVHDYPPFYNGLGAWFLWRAKRIPFVEEIHHIVGSPSASDAQEWIGRWMSRAVIPFIARRAAAVRVVSQLTEGVLLAWKVQEEKVQIIPSFYLDHALLAPDASIQKQFDLVTCARLVKNKGLFEILEAMAIVKNISLLVIGDGPLRKELEMRAKALGVRVHCCGWLPTNEDVYKKMQSAKVFVMNSRSEGGPRTLLEAMALGMPVIATNVGVVPNLLQNLILTTGKPDDLSGKIKLLLGDTELQRKLGASARIVLQLFGREHLVKTYADFLQNAGRKPVGEERSSPTGLRLLIITQKVDRRNPVLGFFHRWIEEFSKHCGRVTVIGQSTGTYEFPENVAVQSMRKEKGESRIGQILHFWGLIWSERKNYDAVFVHMVPLWIALGAPVWLLLRKPMYLWYEARGARWPLRIALLCVRKVFSASKHGMPLPTKKSVTTGHGIDTDRYRPGEGTREKGLLVTVSRITRAKRLHVLINTLASLPREYHLTIVGGPITKDDQAVLSDLKDSIARRGLKERVTIQSLTPKNVLPLLQRAEAFLHASETSLDKSILEAMASSCIPFSSGASAEAVLPELLRPAEDRFAEQIQHVLTFSEAEKDRLRHGLREKIVHEHALPKLIERFIHEMK